MWNENVFRDWREGGEGGRKNVKAIYDLFKLEMMFRYFKVIENASMLKVITNLTQNNVQSYNIWHYSV